MMKANSEGYTISSDRDRIERLEKLVTELRDEVEQLKHRVG